MGTQNYTYLPYAVLRIPFYPVSKLDGLLKNDSKVDDAVGCDEFLDLVLMASPELYHEYRREMNKNGTSSDKIKTSLFKYLERACVRCTPFASLASLLRVPIKGCETSVRVNDCVIYNLTLDYRMLQALSAMVPDDKVKYYANDTIYKLGDWVRYMSPSTGSVSGMTLKELRTNRLLNYVLGVTKTGMSRRDITMKLLQETDFSEDEINSFIDTLIASNLLLSDISPKAVSGNETNRILDSACGEYPWVSELKMLVNEYVNSGDAAKRIDVVERIGRLIEKCPVKVPTKNILKLDTYRRKQEGSTIGENMVEDIVKCLNMMYRLFPVGRNSTLQSFKSRFYSKYEEQEIDLLVALDPDAGIGYGPSSCAVKNPLLDWLVLPDGHGGFNGMGIMVNPTTLLLHDKLRESISNHYAPIEISDDDINKLPPQSGDLPTTISAMGQFVGGKDNYRVVGLRFCGPSAANLLGRFSDNIEILSVVNQICSYEQEMDSEVIHAEINHLPSIGVGNISARAHFREYEISYLSPSAGAIPLNDITVRVRNNRLELRSKTLDKLVMPRLTNAHNYRNKTSGVFQFLSDMQNRDVVSGIAFSWNGLESLYNHLPRVNYKNFVLSPEMWYLETPLASMKKKHITPVEIKCWATENKISDIVLLAVGDNKLIVNFDSPRSVEAFVSELPKQGKIILQEYIECGDTVTDENGNCYCNEFIIPLVKKA